MGYCCSFTSARKTGFKLSHLYAIICLCLCLICGICTVITTHKSHSGTRCATLLMSTLKADDNIQNLWRNKVRDMARREERTAGGARKLLGGVGSSPPRCASKCGRCTPCKPVHVPVPPGRPVTNEYYPEAWRCKCGNKLYMP